MQRSIFLLFLFSISIIHLLSAQDPKVNQSPKSNNSEIFEFVDVFPRFYNNECETMDIPNNEKKKCADIQLRRYISKTVGYPEEALLRGDQGTVYVRFVVMEDGHIAQVELVKNMTESQALAEASLQAVKSMNALEQRWIPGYQNGRAVRVRIVLPIKFRLTEPEPEKKKKWWQRLFSR